VAGIVFVSLAGCGVANREPQKTFQDLSGSADNLADVFKSVYDARSAEDSVPLYPNS
jgi:hypothetical protein